MSFLMPNGGNAPAAPPPPPGMDSTPVAVSTAAAQQAAAAASGKGKSGTIKSSTRGAPAPETTQKMLQPVMAGTKAALGT